MASNEAAHPQRSQTVTPYEAAGRALHTIEHPCAHPTTWDALNQDVKDWWVERARPITEAIRKAMA